MGSTMTSDSCLVISTARTACLGRLLALNSRHERIHSLHSDSLLPAIPLSAGCARWVADRQGFQECLPDRRSSRLVAVRRQHWCGRLPGRLDGHCNGHKPAWTGLRAAAGVIAEVARHSQGKDAARVNDVEPFDEYR